MKNSIVVSALILLFSFVSYSQEKNLVLDSIAHKIWEWDIYRVTSHLYSYTDAKDIDEIFTIWEEGPVPYWRTPRYKYVYNYDPNSENYTIIYYEYELDEEFYDVKVEKDDYKVDGGRLLAVDHYLYDDQENAEIDYTKIYNYSQDTLRSIDMYRYDASGDSSLYSIEVHKYYESGLIESKTETGVTDTIYSKELYTYNEKNYLDKYQKFSSNSTGNLILNWRFFVTYNSDNDIEEINMDAAPRFRIEYEYNTDVEIESTEFTYSPFMKYYGLDKAHSEHQIEKLEIYTIVNGVEKYYGDEEYYYRQGGPVKVNEQVELDIKIYPNPVRDFIRIDTESLNNAEFTLFDTKGRVILIQQLSKNNTINVRDIPSGIYNYKLETNEGQASGSLVIQ